MKQNDEILKEPMTEGFDPLAGIKLSHSLVGKPWKTTKQNDEILKELKPIVLSLCAQGYFAHNDFNLFEETKSQIEAKLENYKFLYEQDLNKLAVLIQEKLEAKDRELEELRKRLEAIEIAVSGDTGFEADCKLNLRDKPEEFSQDLAQDMAKIILDVYTMSHGGVSKCCKGKGMEAVEEYLSKLSEQKEVEND